MPQTITRRFLFASLPALVLALLLSGCGSSGSSDGNELPYQVGDSLSDASLALVVTSEYGSDTVRTGQYQRQAKMRTQKLPPGERSADTLQSIHRDLVRRVVEGHVLRGKAKAEDVSVDSAQVASRLDQIKQRYPSEEQLKKQLAQNNMTMDSLRSLIAQRMQSQVLRKDMAEAAEAPTSAEVEEYSKKNPRIRAQHILIRARQNASQTKVDSARKAAQALVDSAKAGVDFAALAQRHSEGPSARKGGDLGFFTKDQMVDSFSDAAFALSDSGDVASEPVRTRFGFHVIRLTNPGEPMDTSKARQQMMQKRKKESYDAEVEKLMTKATVHVNPSIVQSGFYE